MVAIDFNAFLPDDNFEDPEICWLLSAGNGAGTGKSSSGEERNGTGDGGGGGNKGGGAIGEGGGDTGTMVLEQACTDILLSGFNTPSIPWHRMDDPTVHIFGLMILTLLRTKLLRPPPFETFIKYSGIKLGRTEPVGIYKRCSKINGEGIE